MMGIDFSLFHGLAFEQQLAVISARNPILSRRACELQKRAIFAMTPPAEGAGRSQAALAYLEKAAPKR